MYTVVNIIFNLCYRSLTGNYTLALTNNDGSTSRDVEIDIWGNFVTYNIVFFF